MSRVRDNPMIRFVRLASCVTISVLATATNERAVLRHILALKSMDWFRIGVHALGCTSFRTGHSGSVEARFGAFRN